MGNNQKRGQENGSEQVDMRDGIQRQPAHPRGRGISQTIRDPTMGNLVKHNGNQDRKRPK